MSAGMDLDDLNRELETASPREVLTWVTRAFRDSAVASSSFQTQSVPLLHMISQVCPELPVIFVDTGFHFPETLLFRDKLEREWGLNVMTVYPDSRAKENLADSAKPLYRRDPDLCCRLNKVKPMMDALREFNAWVTGIRRDQTHFRSDAGLLERHRNDLVKINPLVQWSSSDVWAYIDRHGLPLHPLFREGYKSIGCAPCTRPVSEGEPTRGGRWDGTSKTECGLHTVKTASKCSKAPLECE